MTTRFINDAGSDEKAVNEMVYTEVRHAIDNLPAGYEHNPIAEPDKFAQEVADNVSKRIRLHVVLRIDAIARPT